MESDVVKKTVTTTSPVETRALGYALASSLRGGDVVLLSGTLGAGKTCLVSGLAEGMRVQSPVSSPTFTLLHTHEPQDKDGLFLHHMDVYRLQDADAFLQLGFYDLITENAVLFIEWGCQVREVLSDDVVEIRLEQVSDDVEEDNCRHVTLLAPSSKANRFLKAFDVWEACRCIAGDIDLSCSSCNVETGDSSKETP